MSSDSRPARSGAAVHICDCSVVNAHPCTHPSPRPLALRPPPLAPRPPVTSHTREWGWGGTGGGGWGAAAGVVLIVRKSRLISEDLRRAALADSGEGAENRRRKNQSKQKDISGREHTLKAVFGLFDSISKGRPIDRETALPPRRPPLHAGWGARGWWGGGRTGGCRGGGGGPGERGSH